ncbi:MAG: dTDP-4-dehydrorhamnose 3,5-epimerase [Anaerolineae bacterium]
MPFQFQRLAIPDVLLVEAQTFDDNRGFFMETYKRSDFAAHGIADAFVQCNRSHSVRGVLRGLHYQIHPRAQAKLVSALQGEIFDVAVDIRHGSPTYGRWVGERLSGQNGRMLYVPVGFAHGFCALSDRADVLYMVTDEYAPECDRGLLWNDPDIGIDWPITTPILSAKDAQLPTLRQADNNFALG